MRLQRRPNLSWASNSVCSSSWVHLALTKAGSNTLLHRSRHCTDTHEDTSRGERRRGRAIWRRVARENEFQWPQPLHGSISHRHTAATCRQAAGKGGKREALEERVPTTSQSEQSVKRRQTGAREGIGAPCRPREHPHSHTDGPRHRQRWRNTDTTMCTAPMMGAEAQRDVATGHWEAHGPASGS